MNPWPILWDVLSWGIVAVAGVAALRLALKPPFRRDLAALPTLRNWLLIVGLIAVALGIWTLWRFPVLLHVAAFAAAGASAFLWWRARPSYGRTSGWPPGSLGIGASLDAIDNRDYYLEQAARYGPIFKMSQFGRPVLCVVGLARGRQLLQDHGAALAGASLTYNRFIGNGLLRYMARDDHQTEGPLFRRAFSMIALDANEDAVRQACRRRLEALAESTARAEAGVDIRTLIRSWTNELLANVFFGLSPDDPRVQVIDTAQRTINLERIGGRAWRSALQRSLASATEVLREVGREHQARGDTTSVLGALVSQAPESLENEGRLRNLFMTFRLGTGDMANALAWVVYQLSTHPQWQDAVCRAGRTSGPPRGAQPSDLGSRVVLETLRLEQSEFLYRRIVKPIEFESFKIPAGWIVRICIQESHRDPQIFAEPALFNPDRFVGRVYGRSEYATFGLDDHACMGTTLVHFFGRILVEEMCAAYTWRITRQAPLEHGTRHRHHWRPGREWRIALHSRASQVTA